MQTATESTARLLNSVFWAGLVIGRLLAIPISSRARPGPIAGCINVTVRHMQITSQVTAVFLIGASLGSMMLPWLVGRLFVPLGPEAML